MHFDVVLVGECQVLEEALRQWESEKEGQMELMHVQSRTELLHGSLKDRPKLIVLPVEWLDEAEYLKKSFSCVRLLAYGEAEKKCSDVIALGADNYFSNTITKEQCMSVINCECHFLYMWWERNAEYFAREKARNQLIYARIRDSFENTTLEMINRKFHFQFHEGLFRAILLRIDYMNQNRELFDWFYMFDEKIIVEILELLQEICYDVYVEFRMNGPMFYCNYADDKDTLLFDCMEQLCDKRLQDVAENEKLQLSIRMGSAYHDIQNLQNSREEAYNAYQEYIRYDGCDIQLYRENENMGAWYNKRVRQIGDMLCTAGANLDVKMFDQSIASLKSMDLKIIVSLFSNYIDYFFKVNARLIESYTNLEHLRKKMIQTMNFSGTKEILLHNFREQNHVIIGDILRAAPRGMRTIHRARRYVEEHYMEKISVTDISDYLGLNASYFSHLFTMETGQHFSEFISEFRISRAIELLTTSDLSVREIAEKVGYSDQRYFSRMFRRVTKRNPTEFRKNSSHTNINV